MSSPPIRIPIREGGLDAADRFYLAAVGRGVLLGAVLMFLLMSAFRP